MQLFHFVSGGGRRTGIVSILLASFAVSGAVSSWYLRKVAASRVVEPLAAHVTDRNTIAHNYGELPLSFEINDGQAVPDVKFISRGPGYDLFLTSSGAVINLRRNLTKINSAPPLAADGQQIQSSSLRLRMIGAKEDAAVSGDDELAGKVNYFVGNDPSAWHTNISTYRKVRYTGIFSGIDLVYYGNRTQLEYDFVLAARANVASIKFQIDGAEKIRIGDKGDLRLTTRQGEIQLQKPQLYQLSESGARQLIEGGYVIRGKQIGFKVSSFDSAKPLVIDPVLSYSTLLGTPTAEQGNSIAVDAQGNAYITGNTISSSFPTTSGALQTTSASSTGGAFVTKLDATGTNLIYSTYLSGSSGSSGASIAVDSAGDAYVCGSTQSSDFPSVNAIRGAYNFLKTTDSGTKWNGLNFSPPRNVLSLAVDPQTPTNLYAAVNSGTGILKSTDGGDTWVSLTTTQPSAFASAVVVDPQTPATVYAVLNSGTASVIKSTNGGASWTALSGLSGTGFINTIAIDPTSPATLYLGSNGGYFKTTNGGTTWTRNTNLATANTFAINPTNSAIVYAGNGAGVFKSTDNGATWAASSTGLPSASVRALAIDPAQTATIYAATSSGVFKSTNSGGNWSAATTGIGSLNVASLAINPASPATLYAGTSTGKIFKSTDGGNNWSVSFSLIANASVSSLVVDPLTPSRVYAGSNASGLSDGEAFVSKLNPAGSGLIFSTFLGGSGNDSAAGIAIDSSQSVYVTGTTSSTDFLTANPFQSSSAGSNDAFVAKIDPSGGSLIYSTYLGGASSDTGAAIAVDPGGNAYLTGTTSSNNFPLLNAFQSTRGDQFVTDAFVTKLNATGGLAYSTYLGGNQSDSGFSIACDSSDNAYVAGSTLSSNFPTASAIQSTNGGGSTDAFVSKINTIGSGLVYSTYLGGSSTDAAKGIAVDAAGNAYVAGFTSSSDYPLVAGALRTKSPFYKSSNGGNNWSNDNYGLKGTPVSAIAVNPVTSSTIFAGTQNGISKSTDGGRTWSPSMAGLVSPVVRTFAINPQTPSIMYIAASFAPPNSSGVFKSIDGGASWSAANNGLPNAGVNCLAMDPVTPTTLYSVTSNASLFKSTDSGANWTQIGPNPFFAVALVIDPVTPTTLYAADSNSGGKVSKSTDSGATWQVMSNGLTSSGVSSLAIDPVTPATVYTAGFSGGIFKTTNGGANWTSLNTGLSGPIVIDPRTPSTLYIGTSSGIFKSTNGGSTWAAVNNGLQTAVVASLAVNPASSVVYAGMSASSFDEDAFVTKINATGTSLVYSTLIGGPSTISAASNDDAFAIAIDVAGSAYITGTASSTDFPISGNAYQPFVRGANDVFVSKLSNSYLISGQVVDGSNAPVSGVEVTLNDGSSLVSVLTEADGSYQFSRLREGGNFIVSAAKPHFTMAPASQTFNNLTSNQTQNFVATATSAPFFNITGQVTTSGTPLSGVAITLSGSQSSASTTDSNGNYSFTLPGGGNYTVTPSMLGFTFSPPSQTFSNLSADQAASFTANRQNFVVTNANDHGTGSLRQALLDANATPGTDTITFNIPMSGVQTINLLVALPTITDPVVIDATTQPGYSGAPLIELNGSQTGGGNGLRITAGNSTIRGLIINRFQQGIGISLETNGGNTIQGNYIGTDSTGTSAQKNNGGISIGTGSTNNLIGGTSAAARNVISGNSFHGVGIAASNNQIQGNFIGTNAAGNAAIPTGTNGIEISSSSFSNNLIGGTAPGAGNLISGNPTGVFVVGTNTVIQGNLIGTDASGLKSVPNGIGVNANFSSNILVGGLTPGARNIISGNSGDGVLTSGNMVQGNFIGTDITGSAVLGNGGNGVTAGNNALVGGTAAGAGNVISGNGATNGFANVGIGTNSFGSATIQGNFIGTDVTGMIALNNPKWGIAIGTSSNTIGGSTSGARNIISGNTVGIQFGGFTSASVSANLVQGNYIGLNQAGTGPLPNTQDGIRLEAVGTTQNNIIGGVAAGAGNTIAFNGGNGVLVNSGVGNSIRGNSIFSNGGLGIDLAPAGVTANDQGDGDTGANNRQNFPSLTSLTPAANPVTINGTLNSAASTTFTIDFYSNTSCDASGSGEGAQFIGSTTATTAADGNATINFTLASALPPGTIVTATATDPAGNTSEFSPCRGTAVISLSQSNFAVSEGAGFVNVTVTRSGDTGTAVAVDYASSDGMASLVSCATANGLASSKCDFTTALGTLRFSAGETSKTVSILINQDTYVEGPETFAMNLSNLSEGARFGANSSATITINDDATEPSGNAIDDTTNFVRQHYHDFLNREPDQSGLDFWVGTITSCGTDPQCIEVKRINLSGAFFLSIEFQQTGYLVERLYKTAYGDAVGNSTFPAAHTLPVPIVKFNEFLGDTQEIGRGVVVGQPGWEQQLENNKVAFINLFVQRARFTSALGSMGNAQFVDTLNANAGNPLSQAERDQFVADLNSGAKTRAQVLRTIAEHPNLVNAEFNRAFVLMQFFGYLRRNPDDPQDHDHTGYDFWLTKLNQFGGNFQNAEMVKAFISADEYRHRFGP